jgi:hypothetical protein
MVGSGGKSTNKKIAYVEGRVDFTTTSENNGARYLWD